MVEVTQQIHKGRALCLGEGEGRNAVHLAQQGYQVTAVDASAIGLEKAQKLAVERSVRIETIVADLADFQIQPHAWAGIVSIFCHLPPVIRAKVHRQVVDGLRSQAIFILEAYTPRQLNFKTDGTPAAKLMMDLATLERELQGLKFKHALELDRDIQEGQLHQGCSAAVQIVASKT